MRKTFHVLRLLCVALLAFPAVACAQDLAPPANSPAADVKGEGTRLKVQVAASETPGTQSEPVILELKNVELPEKADALRVYVIPKGDAVTGEAPVYLTSLARGQGDKSERTAESYTVEVSGALKRLEQQGKYTLRAGDQVEILLQPITAESELAPGPLKVGNVAIKLEDPMK